MKKIWFLGIVFFILISSFVFAETLYSSYESVSNVIRNYDTAERGDAVRFVPSDTICANGIAFYFDSTSGTPEVRYSIWNDAGKPNYEIFEVGTSTISNGWVKINSSTDYIQLFANTTYWLVSNLTNPNGGSSLLMGDTSVTDSNYSYTSDGGLTWSDPSNAEMGYRIYVIDCPTAPFELTLKNVWDNALLSNFTAEISNGSSATNISTENGSIYWTRNEIVNVTIFNINHSGHQYFNVSYINYNTSIDLEATTYQAILNVSVVDFNTYEYISNFNITIGTTKKQATNNHTIFYINSGEFNVTADVEYYNSTTVATNITELQINYLNISATRNTFNYVYFYDLVSGNPISDANVRIEYPDGSEIEKTTNTTGGLSFSYFYNGINQFGTYNITFLSQQGFVTPISFQEDLFLNNTPKTMNFSISRTTIHINIYSRADYTLITNPVSVVMLGVFNETTTNGTVTYQDITLASGKYTIQAIANGYKTEQITFTYNAQENATINFYLIETNITNYGTLYVTVIDEFYRYIPNAMVHLQEYDPVTKSFIMVSESLTNINGEASFGIELGTKTYIISAYKVINGISYSASTGNQGEIITTDNEVRQLMLKISENFEVPSLDYLRVSIDEGFVNNISNINVSYYTTDGSTATICLAYFIEYPTYTEEIYKNCTTTASGYLSRSALLNRNYDYLAEVYQDIDGYKIVLKSFPYPSETSLENILEVSGLLKFFILFLWISLLSYCIYTKNVSFFSIGGTFIAWFTFFKFPTQITAVASTVQTILLLSMLFISRKKQEST